MLKVLDEKFRPSWPIHPVSEKRLCKQKPHDFQGARIASQGPILARLDRIGAADSDRLSTFQGVGSGILGMKYI